MLRGQLDRHSNVLLVLTSNTYQAYNKGWDIGDNDATYPGPSLYAHTNGIVSRNRPLHAVPIPLQPPADQEILTPAFGNPYPLLNGSFYSAEWPFVRWAEAPGDAFEGGRDPYSFDYAVDTDLENYGDLIKYKLIVKVGHDEYYSPGMRSNLERFVRNGGNVALLTGNTMHFRVTPDLAKRTITCLKGQAACVQHCGTAGSSEDCTTLWSSGCAVNQSPEDSSIGVGMRFGGYYPIRNPLLPVPSRPDAGAFAVATPSFNSVGAWLESYFTAYRTEGNKNSAPFSWVFDGVQLDDPRQNDRYPTFGRGTGMIGYECDGCDTNWAANPPTPQNAPAGKLSLLASAPASWSGPAASRRPAPSPTPSCRR